jgi:DNA-damage-inducible protein D
MVSIASKTAIAEGRNSDWCKLKQRLNAEGGQPVTFFHGLKLTASDGKQRETDCANTEGLFRIIKSIPSPKAEPFKRWLAQVGYERVKEIENPELASARARELYQAKGYPQAWIEKRLRSISVRGELSDEWKARGFDENRTSAKEGGKIAGNAEQVQSSGEVKGRPLISRRFKRQWQVSRLVWRCL